MEAMKFIEPQLEKRRIVIMAVWTQKELLSQHGFQQF
jgi:hypothetical protein